MSATIKLASRDRITIPAALTTALVGENKPCGKSVEVYTSPRCPDKVFVAPKGETPRNAKNISIVRVDMYRNISFSLKRFIGRNLKRSQSYEARITRGKLEIT